MCSCSKHGATLARFAALDPRPIGCGCHKPDPCDPCGGAGRRAASRVAAMFRPAADRFRGLR